MVRISTAILPFAAIAIVSAIPVAKHDEVNRQGVLPTKEIIIKMFEELEQSRTPEQERMVKKIYEATLAEKNGKDNPEIIRLVEEEKSLLSEDQRKMADEIVNAILAFSDANGIHR
ncbi:hypothetical protein CDD81_4895 [Ophiocordyceps australis]|uniref:Uncharacterized protein n=1 Tax=Ophiocordyceps australis TaxID=1399860 RepID=A0A2C5XIS3_9HYPO|nr:hypothetical protein CDD81_4895 [Ophiocordyceps australis]